MQILRVNAYFLCVFGKAKIKILVQKHFGVACGKDLGHPIHDLKKKLTKELKGHPTEGK